MQPKRLDAGKLSSGSEEREFGGTLFTVSEMEPNKPSVSPLEHQPTEFSMVNSSADAPNQTAQRRPWT